MDLDGDAGSSNGNLMTLHGERLPAFWKVTTFLGVNLHSSDLLLPVLSSMCSFRFTVAAVLGSDFPTVNRETEGLAESNPLLFPKASRFLDLELDAFNFWSEVDVLGVASKMDCSWDFTSSVNGEFESSFLDTWKSFVGWEGMTWSSLNVVITEEWTS